MSRTPESASGLASDSSRTAIAGRLERVRGDDTQARFSARLGLPLKSYTNYERALREIDVRTLVALHGEGWNTNWLLTGEGPERLEAAFQSGSQDMSATDLSMAIQLANEKIAASGLAPTPEQYGKFVLLLYQVLVGGLPDAEIHDFRG